jgi:hypothetical protein
LRRSAMAFSGFTMRKNTAPATSTKLMMAEITAP